MQAFLKNRSFLALLALLLGFALVGSVSAAPREPHPGMQGTCTVTSTTKKTATITCSYNLFPDGATGLFVRTTWSSDQKVIDSTKVSGTEQKAVSTTRTYYRRAQDFMVSVGDQLRWMKSNGTVGSNTGSMVNVMVPALAP